MQIFYSFSTPGGEGDGEKVVLNQYPLNTDASGIPVDFKILVVDDDEDFLEAISYRLKKKKIDVIAVKSGEEAIKKLEGNLFSLILLDMKMPGMNGVETYKKMERLKCGCPVIFMSAYHDENVDDVKKLNPFGFLKKPFDFSQLYPLIIQLTESNNEQGKNTDH